MLNIDASGVYKGAGSFSRDHQRLLAEVASDIRAKIGKLPRVSLGEFPTPLTRCPRFSEYLGGPEIFIKREDLSGLGLGGNKSRLLEFRLAEALKLNADVVVAGLEVQSNSARQLTAAANRLGLKVHLLLRADHEPEWQGNLLVDHILGAEITFVSDPNMNMDTELCRVADLLQRSGHMPYVMNHARYFGIGAALAGLEWTIESCEQLEVLGMAPTHCYLSSGGKCQSGMVIAAKLLGSTFAVVGQNANPAFSGAVEATVEIATDTIDALGLDLSVTPDMVDNRSDHAGDTFGVPTPETIEAIQLLAQFEGIILDPVFSGKAMAGLLSDIRDGKLTESDVVVFVHTGGVPAIFSHAQAFIGRRNE